MTARHFAFAIDVFLLALMLRWSLNMAAEPGLHGADLHWDLFIAGLLTGFHLLGTLWRLGRYRIAPRDAA